MFDALGFVAKQASDLSQHVHKARAAIARGLGEVSAAPDRLAIAVEKHGQRPPAVFAKMVQGRHVELVDVGPLLAVDFDVDEQLVHDGSDPFVFEAFMRHDMAPVAGCVADREQDRLVALLGFAERVRTPRPPVDRIGLVLQQIRARLMGEAVLAQVGSDRYHGCHWVLESTDWNVGAHWAKCKQKTRPPTIDTKENIHSFVGEATIGDVQPARYYFCTLIRPATGRDSGRPRQWSGAAGRHHVTCRTRPAPTAATRAAREA